ncbi:MAG TPA: 2-methylaconitate cis-trans isomerase PrpF [Burkholderiaceae bacterium]|nr:2-methylaconitate cis-trans isomerase PrpF [Burkholderiaceae bacterium]
MSVRRIPAVHMRGGTSKGLFFHARDLPASPRARDALLLRAIGSPDPYARHTDGLGGATSSTSKVVLVSRSERPGCDVDFLFGQVAIDAPVIDWSGNCGNLSAAVGPFAIAEGLCPAPPDGAARVRIWQANLGERIDAFVPMRGGEVVETGSFVEDGVPFPGAEIRLEFLEPAEELFPTGLPRETLEVPGHGRIEATLVTAGNPTVFVRAEALGLDGRETAGDVDRNRGLLERLEAIRARAAVRMGLAASAEEATRSRPATPKVAWVARPAAFRSSAGVEVPADSIDVLARIMSMGKLHHAFTGTGSIALAVAAAVPGTVVADAARTLPGVATRIGHASGTIAVGAEVSCSPGADGRPRWTVDKCVLSRSARRLMRGEVFVPG